MRVVVRVRVIIKSGSKKHFRLNCILTASDIGVSTLIIPYRHSSTLIGLLGLQINEVINSYLVI